MICLLCVCVAQSCLALCDPMGCSLPGSSVHGILQASIWEWVANSFSGGGLPKPRSPALQADFLPSEPPLSPIYWLISWLIAIHVAPWLYYTLDYNSVLLYFVAQNSRKTVLVFFSKSLVFFPQNQQLFFQTFFLPFLSLKEQYAYWKWKWSHSVISDPFNPMDCSLPGSSVHGIFQARVLEGVAISFSKESSWPEDWTWVSCIAGWFFTVLSICILQPKNIATDGI